jgi:hypothetical protein
MLANRRLNRLNGATRECLEQCYQSDNWLDCLANYVEELRADGWCEEDIEEVETTVVRILRALTESEPAPAAPPLSPIPSIGMASAAT